VRCRSQFKTGYPIVSSQIDSLSIIPLIAALCSCYPKWHLHNRTIPFHTTSYHGRIIAHRTYNPSAHHCQKWCDPILPQTIPPWKGNSTRRPLSQHSASEAPGLQIQHHYSETHCQSRHATFWRQYRPSALQPSSPDPVYSRERFFRKKRSTSLLALKTPCRKGLVRVYS
jgi:hypothetical protein